MTVCIVLAVIAVRTVMRCLQLGQIRQLIAGHQPQRRIANPSQILGPRLDVQLRQHPIRTDIGVLLRHRRIWIGHVAKLDRFGRASGLASGLNRPLGNHAVVVPPSVDLCRLDPLGAVRAFFHHAATADRDFRVQLQRLQPPLGFLDVARKRIPTVPGTDLFVVIEIIEPANFERTVISTVSRADAAVVGHRIDALVGVHGRGHRANLFARRGFAVHTRNRLLDDVRVLLVALEITI